ncbi:NAD(P)H-dependent oxidoreductase [Alicyclobacillus cycloheptanicus]|uniref:FMN reductase n=1 Tax=Alicyclobacillus cycloheptanicus TaxID=1457 RepID=A0ABT9XHM0_9BACL|nr:NADPH-dependent FMN reductase [Alicyclobacillus cycloheptanicus]MDQ0189801.1 FMN reductase [Alicyclobacillus cycloheptanicus]WDM02508.1 NAD(P)H-dependent oxidoreductase [Alicyclobacillus cycloheptanicus]
MKFVFLSGSKVGTKTRTALNYAQHVLAEKYPAVEATMIDLGEYDVVFSDGRNYLEYQGDTGVVVQAIMNADAIVIGTPIFQASIPGTLKNVFDLLPENALRDKVASMIVTAGSSKHYLVAEHQLKPILAYMKAQIVQTYVFIEEQDFYRKEIVNDDVLFRMDRLIDDTVLLAETYLKLHEQKEAEYGF